MLETTLLEAARRVIDREMIHRAIDHVYSHVYVPLEVLTDFVAAVEELQALKARRCDQCTHWIDDGPESGYEIYCDKCSGDGDAPPGDWYCKFWEARKEIPHESEPS